MSEFHFALPTTTVSSDDHKICNTGTQEDPSVPVLFLWFKPPLNTQMQETLLSTREATQVLTHQP